jgi:subtilisin family serine protease
MMPDVIAAGGVFIDEADQMQASDYASAFTSAIYSGRAVPDFCGLVGMRPNGNYIMLPLPPGCEYDRQMAQPHVGDTDGTAGDDGWSVFSGTSAAAPQLAGVCALLLERNPKLTPSEVKAVLRRTARDVQLGIANPDSTPGQGPKEAGQGDDGATGAGLVDAFAAWKQVS